MRFGSTRDFQRALERALRRAGLPVAFSAGFHPHPRISYTNAAPTGTASEAEYVEISFAARVDADNAKAAIDASLPAGLDIVEVVEAGPGSLAERLEASVWRVELAGVGEEELSSACARLLGTPAVEVTRMTKNGPRTFDARAPIVDMRVEAAGAGCAILRMVVRHTTPAVRPDDVLDALRSVAALSPPTPPLVTRLAQGPLVLEPAQVADPLAAAEEVTGA